MQIAETALGIVTGLSLPLKIAWGVWLVWGCGQLAWYFWPRDTAPIYRTTTTPAPRPPGPRPVAVRAVKRPATVPVAVSPYGTSDFLAALDQEQQAGAAQANQDPGYR